MGVAGPVEGKEFFLDREEIAIGRQPDCEIMVPDKSVSRRHARIQTVPDGFVIEDGGSANGTWVDGVRVTGAQLLQEGVLIRTGTAVFAFECGSRDAAPSGGSTVVWDAEDDSSTVLRDVRPAGEDAPAPMTSEAPEPEASPGPAVGAVEEPQPVLPTPISGEGDQERHAVDVDVPQPVLPAPIPAAPSEPPRAAGDDLAVLRDDLDLLVQQLHSLAMSFSALEGRLARIELPAPTDVSAPLRLFASELEQEGGGDRLRELQDLLEKMESNPTDLKLLLRLSEELPAIRHLVEAHLRILSLVRENDQG